MHLQRLLVGLLVGCAAGSAHAAGAQDFMTDVYASTEEACGALKEFGIGGVEEAGILTADGLRFYEQSCVFIELKPHPRIEDGWFATAICENTGDVWPDIASITPRDEHSLYVTFLMDRILSDDSSADTDESSINDYVRCDGQTRQYLNQSGADE